MDDRALVADALFKTQAIRVCDPDRPFWYTSGTLGPYYINTHFLYGGETAANALLSRIELLAAQDTESFPLKLLEDLRGQFRQDPIFHSVIDAMVRVASRLAVDFISGGERRDFYFSLLLADLLDKPHLSIFKNGSCVLTRIAQGASATIAAGPNGELAGLRSLHVADIVTKAASFTRAWLPVIQSLGSSMPHALVVIDRNQGGKEALAEAGVSLHALAEVDDSLFMAAREAGILTDGQYDTVKAFNTDPTGYMFSFLENHPDFIASELRAGGKAKERALLCIAGGYAQMPPGFVL